MGKFLFIRVVITIFLLFSAVFAAFTQTIAIHPFDAKTAAQITDIFFNELIISIPNVPEYAGIYRPSRIDLMNNRPKDVPPGGFPAYICPPPSLTQDAEYVITGEVGEDANYAGEYWVRLYLWQTDGSRLIASEMMNAADRGSAAVSYPYVLAFLFSKIDELKAPAAAVIDPRFGQKWLYMGLRAGSGSTEWMKPLNFHFAFHLLFNVIYPLAFQTEANVSFYFKDRFQDKIESWNMTIPFFIKFNLHNGPVGTSIYFGPWYFLSLKKPPPPSSDTPSNNTLSGTSSEDNNEQQPEPRMGVSLGITMNYRFARRSSLFFDARFHVMYLTEFSKEGVHYPFKKPEGKFTSGGGVTFSIGYEFGLFNKKPRSETRKNRE
jgi:hypothetical protein